MFAKKNTQAPNQKLKLLLEKTKFQAVLVSSDSQASHHSVLEESWTPTTLPGLFKNIQETTGHHSIDIILGGSLYQLNYLQVESSQDQESVLEAKAATMIPGKIEDLGVDYQILSESNDQKTYQLFVVKKNLLSLIGKSAQNAGLHVLSVEGLPQVLASNRKSTKPELLLWQDDLTNLALVYQSKAYLSLRCQPEDVYKQIDSLLSSTSTDLNLNITSLVMAKDTADSPNKPKLKAKKLKLKEADLNPFAENDELGFDADSSSPPSEVFAEQSEDSTESTSTDSPESTPDKPKDPGIMGPDLAAPKPPLKVLETEKTMDAAKSNSEPRRPEKSNTKAIVIIVTILAVLAGLVGGGLLVYRNALSDPGQQPQVIESDATPTPSPTPLEDPDATASGQVDETSSDSEIDRAEIAIQILNGSGVPGAAGDVADLLTAENYDDIDTGNASSFDYDTTEVRVAAGNQALFADIESILEVSYEITQGDPLDEDSDFDVVITVGDN